VRNRAWILALVVVAVIAAGGAFFVGRATVSTTTSIPPTTSTTVASDVPAVWPTSASGVRYLTPAAAARGFANDVLAMSAPVVGTFRAGDSRSGEVPVYAYNGGPETIVLVRQVTSGDSWWVIGATTASIDVTSPATLATVTSPLAITGKAVAFEGVVNVSLLAAGVVIARTTVMGGGDMKRAFSGPITFATPHSTYGALLLYVRSAKDGSVVAAGCQLVRFS
jgi:hypothetical protein